MTKNSDTITLSKETAWKFVTFTLLGLLVVSVFTGGFGFKDTSNKGQPGQLVVQANAVPNAPAANPGSAAPQPRQEVSLSGAFVKGDENAPVTIVEYSDFQCPFCGRFYSETLTQIDEQYIKTGKVKFAYKDFPLDSIHPQATPAALASRCAGEQNKDKFWELHDLIFKNQAAMSEDNYKKWALEIGLDEGKFNECLDSQKYLNEVRADLQEGQAAGVRGTPGFLVAGQLVSGAQPFAVFQQIIEAELARAG